MKKEVNKGTALSYDWAFKPYEISKADTIVKKNKSSATFSTRPKQKPKK